MHLLSQVAAKATMTMISCEIFQFGLINTFILMGGGNKKWSPASSQPYMRHHCTEIINSHYEETFTKKAYHSSPLRVKQKLLA